MISSQIIEEDYYTDSTYLSTKEKLDEFYLMISNRIELLELFQYEDSHRLSVRFNFMREEFTRRKLHNLYNADGTRKTKKQITLQETLDNTRYEAYIDAMDTIMYFIENKQSVINYANSLGEKMNDATNKVMEESFLIEQRFKLHAPMQEWNLGNTLLRKLNRFVSLKAKREMIYVALVN